MKMKQAIINGIFAMLLVLAITACSSDANPNDKDTDTDDNDSSVITYTADQTGGTDSTADSNGIVFTFSASVDDLGLTAENITVGGKAVKGSELTGSDTSLTLPITVTAAGLATIAIVKDGIETEMKYITVHKNGQPTPNIKTITWNFNGGTAETNAQHPMRIEEGEILAKPSNPRRANDSFVDWYSNSGMTQEYDFSNPVIANLNLYAGWIRDSGIIVGDDKIEDESNRNVAGKLTWIKDNVQKDQTYTIEVNADESIDPRTLHYINRSGVAIILRGIGEEKKISLSQNSSGSLFIVESGVTLILAGNITLNGGSGGNSLVRVNSGGALEMETGAKITGNNTSSSSYVTYGGGVYVSGGTFTMNGGEISGNSASSPNGTFGGGVYVSNGTFIMNSGTISGNSAFRGGGVCLNGGTFAMYGGEISGNSASFYGGGVYVNSGAFTKRSGGTITGYASDQNGNRVTNDDTVENDRGHAVYVNLDSGRRRETTAGPEVELDSAADGGWES